MGRPEERISPFKRRSPLGIISKKVRDCLFSASSAFGRSFSKLSIRTLHRFHWKFSTIYSTQLPCICATDHSHLFKMLGYLTSINFSKRFASSFNSSFSFVGKHWDNLNKCISEFARLIRICHLFRTREECICFTVKLFAKVNLIVDQKEVESFGAAWGMLISEISVDWSQQEFFILMQTLIATVGFVERVDCVLRSEDTQWEEELALRRLLRGLFLDHRCPSPAGVGSHRRPSPHHAAFRLSVLLRLLAPDQMLTAHRLVLIVGAPVGVSIAHGQLNDADNNEIGIGKEFVDYQRIYTEPITDLDSAHTILGELPSMVALLLETSTIAEVEELRWNELEVFNFLEMLTTYPEPWVLRNFATLLIMAPGLARVAVQTRALHGNPGEAGSTFVSCVEASILLKYQASFLLRDTLHSLLAKCEPTVCLVVVREAISCMYLHTLEILPSNQQNMFDNLDMDLLRIALEISRQVAEMLLSHLQFIFV
uniref:Protein lines n=1 Tax=Globodera pallida TaxID=36090 RepID=A0A183C0K6_GLOPA